MLDDPDTLALLRQIADARSTGLAVRRPDGTYAVVNRTFADAAGRPAADILGRDDAELGLDAVRPANARCTTLLDRDGGAAGSLVQSADAEGGATLAIEAELRRARALTRLSQRLTATSDPEDDLDTVCRALLDAIDIKRASVYFVDGDGALQPHAAWHVGETGAERAPTVTAQVAREGICQWSCDTGRHARIGRDENDSRESARVHEIRREFDVGSTCCAPILRDGRGVGSLMISRSRSLPDFDDADAELFTTVASQLSMALERHQLSTALHHQAYHDSLTGLPNRRRFECELAESLAEPERHGGCGAVLFLDLDGFKLVNDTLGHAVGDALLRQVAKRLTSRLKAGDVLARMGGDEFAVIVRALKSRGDAIDVGRRLAESLAAVFDVDGARLKIGTSIGVSHFPDDGASVDALLRHADAAMYQAKNGGKGRIMCFDQDLASGARRRAELEFELREALGRDQFRLVYQPQVGCASGRVEGVEALVRWEHPERGTVSPLEFIPIAEEAGLINAIGAWVLEEAVRRRAAWRGTELDEVRVSVNIAASQFLLENFAEQVLATLERHGVEPRHVELEVTESVVMNDVEAVVRRLNALRSVGVRVAVDDFGTGYSSLSYLQDLPLDVLKIDRSFVTRLEDERGEHSLVNTILLLASGLGLETIAEGVETASQQAKVTALGCDLVQGYLHSPPVAPDALFETVRRIHAEMDGGVAGPATARRAA